MFLLTTSELGQFGAASSDIGVNVTEGNTALIPCPIPSSRPAAITRFEHNGAEISSGNGESPLLARLHFPVSIQVIILSGHFAELD